MRPMRPRQPGSPHEMLVEAMNEIGAHEGRPEAGVEIAADFLGKSHWTLRTWLNPDTDGDISFVRLAQLASRFRLQTVARYFAALARGIFLPLDTEGLDDRWGELTGKTAEEMGKFTAEILRDLSDGTLSKVEAGRCLKIHTQLMKHHAQLHSMLRTIAEGGEL